MSRRAFALGAIGASFAARGRMPRVCHLPGGGGLGQKLVGCLNSRQSLQQCCQTLETLITSNDAWHPKQRPCPLEHLIGYGLGLQPFSHGRKCHYPPRHSVYARYKTIIGGSFKSDLGHVEDIYGYTVHEYRWNRCRILPKIRGMMCMFHCLTKGTFFLHVFCIPMCSFLIRPLLKP